MERHENKEFNRIKGREGVAKNAKKSLEEKTLVGVDARNGIVSTKEVSSKA